MLKLTRGWNLTVALVISTSLGVAHGDARDQALRLHKRLTMVEPTQAVLNQMTALISQGNLKSAAVIAIDHDKLDIANASFSPRAKFFYDNVLMSMFNPWVTNANLPNTQLNDYYALLIGLVRENIPFVEALYSDLIFVGQGANVANYDFNNNNNYANLEGKIDSGTASLAAEVDFRQDTQTNVITAGGTINTSMNGRLAGIFSLRGFGSEFYSAGTNRRVAQTVYSEYLCHKLDTIKDNTVSDFRIRRDVDRSPAGSSQNFITNCKGCHAGMDAQMGAFCNYDFNGSINGANTNYVQNNHKCNKGANVNNPVQGWVTVDEGWVNLWASGQNANLGWDPSLPVAGNGAAEWGEMIAHTEAFASCMAKRAFAQVCARNATSGEQVYINNLADRFKNQNYNMKDLLAEAAILPPCIGI